MFAMNKLIIIISADKEDATLQPELTAGVADQAGPSNAHSPVASPSSLPAQLLADSDHEDVRMQASFPVSTRGRSRTFASEADIAGNEPDPVRKLLEGLREGQTVFTGANWDWLAEGLELEWYEVREFFFSSLSFFLFSRHLLSSP
jgi:hypothetical protein